MPENAHVEALDLEGEFERVSDCGVVIDDDDS